MSNLVAAHNICNRMKPLHATRAAYEAWRLEHWRWMVDLAKRGKAAEDAHRGAHQETKT